MSIPRFIFKIIILVVLFIPVKSYSQAAIANYVSNGGFEKLDSCIISMPNYWLGFDSILGANGNGVIHAKCLGNVPKSNYTYQWPRSGDNFFLTSFFCEPPYSPYSKRWNLRNRLKSQLVSGQIYCVKFYVNISNNSPYGIDGFDAFFGDSSLDTIDYPTSWKPLVFLQPQISNTPQNIITDTLNWTLITGTFVANGSEKYLVLGNLRSTSSTNTILIRPTQSLVVVTDVLIDDVSCIPLNLPSYAGPDQYKPPGDSVFLGRQPDVGIDEACQWFKLPNMTTAFDTVAGLWVKPNITTTYVVRQEICGNVKWDTVVIYMNPVGISERGVYSTFEIFPNPANDIIRISAGGDLSDDFTTLYFFNSLNQRIRKEDLHPEKKEHTVKIADLPEGVYVIQLLGKDRPALSKRLVVSR